MWMVRKALLVAAVGALLAPPATSAAVYDDGVKEYEAGNYKKAVQLLNRAVGAEPARAMAHYYLANALVHIDEHEEAIVEYRMCLALDPSGAVSDYCKRALKSYHRKDPTAAEAKELRDTASGASQKAASPPGGAKVAYRAPSAASPADRSLTLIRKQVQTEKKKDETLAETDAADALTTAQRQVEQIRANAETRIQRLYAAPRTLRQQSPFAQIDLDAAAQKIREEAKEEEEFVLRQGRQKADRCRQVGEMRRTALDQVADDLENQLSDDGKYSGVRMVPEGTNLYVRSYASTPTVRPLPDAHGAVARIYAQHSGDGATDGDSASADKLPSSTTITTTTRTVHGKILKKPN
jgi:tetratricopeptide (TPR) repeat protein